MDFLERVEAWVPKGIGRIYAIMDNLHAHKAYDVVLLFNVAHPRWELIFQPKKYAAYLNLIEPWLEDPPLVGPRRALLRDLGADRGRDPES